MEEIINLIVNNGIGVGALVFMMYFINTAMKENTQALNAIKETLIKLTERVDDIEKRIGSGN